MCWSGIPYITRIAKIKETSISSDVSLLERSILLLVFLVWQLKQQIMKVKKPSIY
ncbi:hypothetical protein BDF21DRAFT_414406 [Thamnidium elegans]|nr:hypothetical protein BDF21DRAFT_414406 [Thamnidium elegans]